MSLNWMRHFELQLLDQNGQGVSLSDFKVTFQIEWADTRYHDQDTGAGVCQNSHHCRV